MTLTRRLLGRAAVAVVVCMSLGLPAVAAPTGAAAKNRQKTVPKASTRTSPKPVVKSAYSPKTSNARRARLARARVAARVRAAREAAIPRYKTDSTGALVPDLHAAAAIIYDPETHQVLWEENSQDKRSIASITKVMTAVVFVESDPDLSQVVVVERPDTLAASTTHLRTGYMVTARGPAASAPHLVRQRGGAGAGPGVAVGAGRVRRQDEREGRGTRVAEHDVRGPVRPRRPERVVGL